jgi:hypothetical protein
MRANFMVYAIARRTGVNMPGFGLLRYLCGSYLAVLSLDGMGQLLALGWRTRRVDATIAPRERILYERVLG